MLFGVKITVHVYPLKINNEDLQKYFESIDPHTGPVRDKIHTIRPLIESLRKRFSSIPIEENYILLHFLFLINKQ
ncbi:piggyBac transposable element-derived protein 3-like [Aphis craccivora]|uniref:PiggyBac transposable element-derived protein 3-like n=1 Tax=Aphis craccivora TaxID=307492 RepID=A0A6G0Y8F1_APHCR|nr:piggyBac transposable element-derived protein 3-like [Aphis craccivora]